MNPEDVRRIVYKTVEQSMWLITDEDARGSLYELSKYILECDLNQECPMCSEMECAEQCPFWELGKRSNML